MPKTVEAVVDQNGQIQLLESLPLRERQRVLVTVLEENWPREQVPEARQNDIIDRLMEKPLKQEHFRPLSREDAHRRT